MVYTNDLRMMIKLLEEQASDKVMPAYYSLDNEDQQSDAQGFIQTDAEKLKTLTSILKMNVADMELSEEQHRKTYKIVTVLQTAACFLCVLATILVKLGVL